MIIDFNLRTKTVVVIGGGNEAEKRINSLLKQDCKIIVLSEHANAKIKKLATLKKIKLKIKKIQDVKFISEIRPDIIITTTDDIKLNKKIIKSAKKKRIIAYSSDNPSESDFSNPSIIDLENVVQIAIFTMGQSPAMSKKIRIQAEKIFKKIVTKEDIAQIKIQRILRSMIKDRIDNQLERKACLQSIMNDSKIDQLIKDGKMKQAEKQAIRVLKDWK